MKECLEIIFRSFWTFAGTYLLFELVFKIINRICRHFNIKSKGWPPPHCDADGDFKEEPEE